jgi:hypothetical protein
LLDTLRTEVSDVWPRLCRTMDMGEIEEFGRRLRTYAEQGAFPALHRYAASLLGLVQGFAAGAVDYITKPFNAPELLARVRTHLELNPALAPTDLAAVTGSVVENQQPRAIAKQQRIHWEPPVMHLRPAPPSPRARARRSTAGPRRCAGT